MAFKTALKTALVVALSAPVFADPLLTKISTKPEDIHGKAFDYVIVGGGAAGLVLANRLSEDSNRTVAVIEAGNDGEAVMERILVPALTYLNGVAVPNSEYDWGYWGSSMGRWYHQPRAKVLGGSTAVNALYVVRASKEEHDAWASLLPNADQDWSWNGLFPYMLKTENFKPPTDASLTGTIVDQSYHGHDGPLHVSYPEYTYQSAAVWTPTLANLGLKTTDPQGGQGWGGFITPNSIDPRDGTRSYAKTAYLDPVANRPNLVVLLQSQATKITFDTTGSVPRATGVDFAQTTGGTIYHVDAASEVIVSGGVFGTPQLLQLSGIGPKPLLDSFGIPTIVDLPGVGEHFQDHVLVSMTWTATNNTVTGDLLVQNATFAAEQLKLFHDGQLSQSLMSAPNNGIGYVSLKQLFNNDTFTAEFIQQMRDNMTAVINNQGFTDDTLRAGYELTYSTEVNELANTDVGAIELLLSSFGSWNGVNRTIAMQAAIQHPMSRGSVKINGTNPFQAPIIAANYLNTDSDWAILRAGVRYLRRVAATEPLASLIVEEVRPGPQAQTDQQIDAFLYEAASTQYHPASTSSMLPLEKGGVVDPSLRVYNTLGLRVIDSSVIPIGMCAHLMAPTYAIAEKGAAMIKANSVPNRMPHSELGAGNVRATISGSLVFLVSLLALAISGML
ncbi:hypothetical protein FRC17_007521 [Serendipita sp. 399]|nr:hypothetical protein FRC17_007521 [Serendipita sp. 399]